MSVDTIVIPAATPPEDEAHKAAMIAKGQALDDAANAAAAPAVVPATERPSWLPEKFKTAEEMATSYAALEAKLGVKPEVPAVVTPAADTPTVSAEAAAAVTAAGLDFGKLNAEFAETGALSAETYAALDKAGIPEAQVNAYIEGQQARNTLALQEVHTITGGKENFDAALVWAKDGMDNAAKLTFNQAVIGTPAQREMAVRGLMAQHAAAVGSEPTLVGGSGVPSTVQGYASRAEMVADMKTPQYKTDPAFRAKVSAKLAVSTIM
jgi:hypothetical protein